MAAISGRLDGRLAKYIYAGGQGGVIDWRLPAEEMQSQWLYAERKHECAKYRGVEKLVRTTPVATKVTKVGSYGGYSYVGIGEAISQYTSAKESEGNVFGQVIANDGTIYDIYSAHSTTGTEFKIRNHGTLNPATGHTSKLPVGGDITIVFTQPINLSVSGEFKNEVVFADPAHLLVNQDYKNGWQGVWGGIPAGNAMHCVRKVVGSERLTAVQSVSPYTDYTTVTGVNETTLNETPIPLLADVIYSFPMKNFAKQTTPSTNAPVVSGAFGLGPVMVQNSHEIKKGALLRESVTGVISTGTEYTNLGILRSTIVDELVIDYETMTYTPEAGGAQLQSQLVEENGQLFIQYHDGTDYHRSAIPIGWADQRARVGGENAPA